MTSSVNQIVDAVLSIRSLEQAGKEKESRAVNAQAIE